MMIQTDSDIRIPLRDGTKVAATLYRPDASGPRPATLIYPPYRKDDLNAVAGDDFAARYFASAGYVCLIVDHRGCGASEGRRWTSFDAIHEGLDGYDVVEWIAAQPWCDGNVGMFGLSYPGATSLETAAQQPPHLKAIAPIMPITEAFELWYPDGLLSSYVSTTWAGMMLAVELLPPSHRDPEGRWCDIWRERLERFDERSREWRAHPEPSDEYWRGKHVDGSKIQAPTFIIGGWRDIFPREVLRIYEELRCPRKLLMGPWVHTHPNVDPIATTDHFELIRRWFDRWLKNEGELDDPGDPLVSYYVFGAERWRGTAEWPVTRTEEQTLVLSGGHRLVDESTPAVEAEIPYTADPTVGAQSLLHDGVGAGASWALDQGVDDLASLSFDGQPLDEQLDIVGWPKASISFALDKGEEMDLTVKLDDLAPDGTSTLITFGSVYLSKERLEQMPNRQGGFGTADVTLFPIAYQVPAGHRLRASIACADFPRRWPLPVNSQIRIGTGGEHGSAVRLPILPAEEWDPPNLPVPDPTVNPLELATHSSVGRSIKRDVVNDRVTTETSHEITSRLPEDSGRLELRATFRFSVGADNPAAACAETEVHATIELADGTKVSVATRTWQSRRTLRASATIDLDEKRFYERSTIT